MLWYVAGVVLIMLVLVWWMMGMPNYHLCLGIGNGQQERMINEAAWEEIPRGFNVPYDGNKYSAIPGVLWEAEQTGSIRQVVLDPMGELI
jgi:hypothetical protein